MTWSAERERLGAELIGAREQIAARWRAGLRDQGRLPYSLAALAVELIIQAGAALADGSGPETPWCRCGGYLRIDARDAQQLPRELTSLWRAMLPSLTRVTLSEAEEQNAKDELGRQLEAALRGAEATTASALRDEAIGEPSLRFGGVTALCWNPRAERAAAAA